MARPSDVAAPAANANNSAVVRMLAPPSAGAGEDETEDGTGARRPQEADGDTQEQRTTVRRCWRRRAAADAHRPARAGA